MRVGERRDTGKVLIVDLLTSLATLTRNAVCFGGPTLNIVTTTPTELQRRALDLLGADLAAV